MELNKRYDVVVELNVHQFSFEYYIIEGRMSDLSILEGGCIWK